MSNILELSHLDLFDDDINLIVAAKTLNISKIII